MVKYIHSEDDDDNNDNDDGGVDRQNDALVCL